MPQAINLKDYISRYYAAPTSEQLEPEARKIGKTLGSWLRGFAQWAVSNGDLHAMAETNAEGQFFRHLVTFGWLQDRVKQYPAVLGDAQEIFKEVEEAITAESKDPSKVQVIHGDFWTGK